MSQVDQLLQHLTSIRRRVVDCAGILSDTAPTSPVSGQLSAIVKDISDIEKSFGLPGDDNDLAIDPSSITDSDITEILDQISKETLSEKDRKLLKDKPHILKTVRCNCCKFQFY